jgi:glycosyltransferase involved in cell wall biosynthesis
MDATFVTSLSNAEEDYYKKIKMPSKKIVKIPAGVDLEKFRTIKKQDVKNFQKKYGLNERFMLSVGRIHESKGFQYLIEAMRNIDMNLVIVGNDGGFKEELEKLIQTLQLKIKVKILEGLSDEEVIYAYKSCFAFVLFSEWEGFGIVAIEAMAAEKPIIVSDRGALPSIVKNNFTGIVSEFPFVNKLEKNIMRLIKNKKLRNEISKNAKEFSKSFSWDNIINLTERMYGEALKNEK